MNKHEARILRDCIINTFSQSERISGELTTTLKEKFGIKSMDDWVLSASEIMELNLDKPELYFMAQIAKIARLMGVPTQEAKMLAVGSFADIKIPSQEIEKGQNGS